MMIETININNLVPFENNPFKFYKDEHFDELCQSIELEGVISPILVRPISYDEYEIISGHRRYKACIELCINEIPAIVKDISHEEATILFVDENLTQRQEILPSEKAHAYQMKIDAIKSQGLRTDLTYFQLGNKLNSYEKIANEYGDSKSQVYRYIRLTHLEPELLEMVDNKEISFGPAVELSYLSNSNQRTLLEYIQSEERTPSLFQARELRKYEKDGHLYSDDIYEIMDEVKGNQKEVIKIPVEYIQRHFSNYMTPREMEDFISKAIDFYCKHIRNKSRNNSVER